MVEGSSGKLLITITTSPRSEVDAGSPGPFAKYGEALSSVRVSVAEEGYQTRYSTVHCSTVTVQYNTIMYSTVQYTEVHYLSRTTTLVTVDTEDRVTVVEQNHTQTGTRTEIQFTF